MINLRQSLLCAAVLAALTLTYLLVAGAAAAQLSGSQPQAQVGADTSSASRATSGVHSEGLGPSDETRPLPSAGGAPVTAEASQPAVEAAPLVYAGYVVDPAGLPISHARIKATDRRGASSTTTSDRDGHFRLQAAQRLVRLRVEHREYATRNLAARVIARDMDIVLDLATSLTVRVQDVNGAALQGARVRVLGTYGQSDSSTDEEGIARLQDLPRSWPVVEVLLRGYEAERVVRTADPVQAVQVTLKAGAQLNGSVVDAQSQQPIPDAHVQSIRLSEHHDVYDEARSDVQGRFSLTASARPQQPTRLLIRAPGYATSFGVATANAVGEMQPLRIELQRGHAIQGRVLRPNGQPAAKARLVVLGAPTLPEGEAQELHADAQGSFRLVLPARGELIVGAYAGRLRGFARFGREASNLIIQLQAAGSISGTAPILSATTRPPQAVAIAVSPANGANGETDRTYGRIAVKAHQERFALRLDERGEFTFEDLPVGAYIIQIPELDWHSQPVSIRPSQAVELPFVAPKGRFKLELRIADERGNPLEGATYCLNQAGQRRCGVTRTRGSITVGGLSAEAATTLHLRLRSGETYEFMWREARHAPEALTLGTP